MCVPPVARTGPVSLDEFRVIAAVPDVLMAIGTRDHRLHWCNERFASAFQRTPEEMHGLRFADYLSQEVVEDRKKLWKPMLEQGMRVEYHQVLNDRRYLTRGAPLADDVDKPGLLLFSFFPDADPDDSHPVATQPIFARFRGLSRAELRVVHAFSKGLTREDIARQLHRSIHTVNDHLKNVYAKMGVDREVDLALLLGRSGVGAFSDQQWEQIIASVPGA